MNNDSLVLRVCFLVSLLHVEHTVSSVKLENLTNVVSLTVKNFDENIAEKHHFVLFYVKRLVLSNSDNVSPLIYYNILILACLIFHTFVVAARDVMNYHL